MLKGIKTILENSPNPIKAEEIAEKLGIDPGANGIIIRGKILDCIKTYNLPVKGGNKGYKLITSKSELQKATESLKRRAENMLKRVKLLEDAYEKYYDEDDE